MGEMSGAVEIVAVAGAILKIDLPSSAYCASLSGSLREGFPGR